jgi:hypothetical protein
MWVDGVHKSLPAFTQGAVVSARTEALAAALQKGVDIFRTTSPSYPIMASVEYAVKCPRNEILEKCVYAFVQKEQRVFLRDDWTKLFAVFGKSAFKVAEDNHFEKPLRIVPMAHHYSNYFSAQSKLCIIVGEPFDFTDLYELYKEDPNKAIAQLNQRAHDKVKELMLDISDREHYEQYEMLCSVNRDRQMKIMKLRKSYFPNELTADKATVAAINQLKESEPDTFEKLMSLTAEYSQLLKKLNLRDWILRKRVLGEWWLRLPVSILLLPFWIFGAIVNVLPLGLAKLINTHLIKDKMLHASIQLGISIAILPIWYLILFILIWAIFSKLWIAAAFLVVSYPSLLLYARSRIFIIKMYNRSRRFFLKLAGNADLKKAVELRKNILQIIQEKFGSSK